MRCKYPAAFPFRPSSNFNSMTQCWFTPTTVLMTQRPLATCWPITWTAVEAWCWRAFSSMDHWQAAAPDRNGVAGGALAFSGSQYVSVAGGGGLNAANAGTVSMWVKWSGTQDADCCGSFGAVLARQANGLFSDDILALDSADPSVARIVWR